MSEFLLRKPRCLAQPSQVEGEHVADIHAAERRPLKSISPRSILYIARWLRLRRSQTADALDESGDEDDVVPPDSSASTCDSITFPYVRNCGQEEGMPVTRESSRLDEAERMKEGRAWLGFARTSAEGPSSHTTRGGWPQFPPSYCRSPVLEP